MLKLTSSVPDILHNTIFPVGQQVLNSVLGNIGLLRYFGNRINYKATGINISDSSRTDGLPNMFDNRIDVDMAYTFAFGEQKWDTTGAAIDYQQLLRSAPLENIFKIVFHEPIGQFTLTEYERPLTITLNCSLKFNDIVLAMDAIQRLQSAYSNGITLTTVERTYFIPQLLYGALYKLFLLQGNEPATFMTYLEHWSGSRIVRTYNRHDTNDVALSIRRNHADLSTSIDFTQGSPEPIGNPKSPDMYGVNVTVTVQLSAPNMLVLTYPIVVKNTLVPRELIPIDDHDLHAPMIVTHPYFNLDRYYQLTCDPRLLPNAPYNIPWYDTWKPPTTLPLGHKPFFIAVILLDDHENTDGVTVIDVETGLGVDLVPAVIASLKLYGSECLSFRHNVNISVFKNNILIEPTTLTLVGGTVLTIPNRDLNAVYRLVISASEIVYAPLHSMRVLNVDIIKST
jgi:hypothetical protein